MNIYHRKLYALLHANPNICEELECLREHLPNLQAWWQQGKLAKQIASSSDRVNLQAQENNNVSNLIKHPISGQQKNISISQNLDIDIRRIASETDAEKVFFWFWRFYPELLANEQQDFLLFPAHLILPDCPEHSYKSTVSALTGAMYPDNLETEKHEHPYIFIFTFSPVQEFIKASRKFLDFWAGSYLLHYLGAKLCWYIAAKKYGPDAVITPSLWGQEIIDALILENYPNFRCSFEKYTGNNPKDRFEGKKSNSLSTAGFPNVITALVPGKKAAEELGKELREYLIKEWSGISEKVREGIKQRTINFLKNSANKDKITEILKDFPDNKEIQEICQQDLDKLIKGCNGSCWEWNKLWQAQIEKTWETYWTAVPLGNPGNSEKPLKLTINTKEENYQQWKEAQNDIVPRHLAESLPTPAEETIYEQMNVGTWWGALQARLGQSIQAVKNTRTWAISTAPGERSTLSGQFSAVHPQIRYREWQKDGFGLSARSMRLFWRLMAEVYPGLFNGSEKLNAIELTKRMAWQYGGVAESLGIKIGEDEDTDYEKLIRFPNLSSIASARFAYEHPEIVKKYWQILGNSIRKAKDKDSGQPIFSREQRKNFYSRTRRSFQIPKTDRVLNKELNGVMFSSKWLADDMGLSDRTQLIKLRELVEKAHKQKQIGFGEGSPADWWVIVLGDGDGMGKYVSGSKLKNYRDYLIEEAIDQTNLPENVSEEEFNQLIEKLKGTKKRMGPATHVGLNRALLDFSNRLVPYLTEERYCGRVVYSGGDDVMAVLPLADLPGYLRSLRAAWCADEDPCEDFSSKGGYWTPNNPLPGLQQRPYFTMGEGATMSMGIVIAHKSVPLPTVLESLWTAEKERAKKLAGKDGLCFRVIYGSGNTLEALMKGDLLDLWWNFMQYYQQDLSPLFYRLAEELPRHACITKSDRLFRKAAEVIINRRDQTLELCLQEDLLNWLDRWEDWAYQTYIQINRNRNQDEEEVKPLGTTEKDLANLLRFSAFWNDKMLQQDKWGKIEQ